MDDLNISVIFTGDFSPCGRFESIAMSERGSIFGIPYFYEGGLKWDPSIPQKGKAAEKGCVGCPWYDIETWRQKLIKELE